MSARFSPRTIVDDLIELERALGHSFSRRELLLQALTHSSQWHESGGDGAVSHNEQMEFLGDSILGFVVSRELFERFPGLSEGQLSKMKAHLVSASHLLPVAERLQLGRFLRLGRSEEKSGGRQKRALLVDAMEAVIAAIYLDAGLGTTTELVNRLLLEDTLDEGIESFPFADYKSALQEYLQASGKPQPRYSVTEERGPEHRKTFTVEVTVQEGMTGRAEGPSKKMAEQEAARDALEQLRERERRLQAQTSGDELLDR